MKDKKLEAWELLKAIAPLGEEEKTKIYYMIQGALLVSSPKEVNNQMEEEKQHA